MKNRGSNLTREILRLVFSFIILFVPISTVYAQWGSISPPASDPSPNPVHLISNENGAVASVPRDPMDGTAVTKYKWNTIYSSKFTVKGLISETDTTYGDCTLYDNGTFNCYEDEHGIDRNYTGTYAYIGTTGYKFQFTFDAEGLQEYRDMLTGWAEDMADQEGAEISNISFSFTSVKTSKVTISKKTGIPGNAKVTIKGKVSAILEGMYATKNFSFSSNITFQPGSGDITTPTVPTGLTATAVSSSQINLSWTASTDNVGVAGYKIYRGGGYLKSVTTRICWEPAGVVVIGPGIMAPSWQIISS